VVKFGKSYTTDSQSYSEIEIIKKIKKYKKYKNLRKYIPKVYYTDLENDVIVMRFYPKYRHTKSHESWYEGWHEDGCYFNRTFDNLELLFEKVGIYLGDVHDGNVRQTKSGQLKIVDLGFCE
jgi:hypothetical protein